MVKAAAKYVPEYGDIVWLEFSPQSGHEQAGHRPALILSPAIFNSRSGLAFVCPITSHVKGHPYEVAISVGLSKPGVVLVDHLKSLDWRSRKAKFLGRAADAVLEVVRAKLATLLKITMP